MTADEGGTNGGTQGEQPEPGRYSVPQAARIIGISERGVRRRIEAGTLAAERDGTRWVVLLSPELGGTGSGTAPPHAVPGGTLPPSTAPLDSVPADLYRELEARAARTQHEKEQAQQQAAYFQGQLEELREHVRLLTDSQHTEQGRSGMLEPATIDTETATPRPWWRRIFG